MTQVVYSGHIRGNAGFSAPEPFDGPPGWTVYKVNQTEVYKITHNLSLTNPHKQLHVVITTKEWGVQAQVFQEANHFIVTTMKEPPLVAKETEFDFIAVHYSKKP